MSDAITSAASRLYGIELQSGPYSVAELRLNQAIRDYGGQIPVGGLNTFVADMLEDPHSGTDKQLSYTLQMIAQAVRGDLPALAVPAIDPDQATLEYRKRVMRTKGKDLDKAGRIKHAEDLRSPCTQEVAVFQAFSRVVSETKDKFVIMDTAPTGHTLLLMDAAGAYHREIARAMGDGAVFTTPHMKLQDPNYTKIVIVSLSETTPVLEAIEMKKDLQRANITPWAWVINQALSGVQTSSPVLQQRARAQDGPTRMVREQSDHVFDSKSSKR